MKTITKEVAIQAYQAAPRLIKNIVDSGQTVSTIVEIGKKHNLVHVDVFGKLAKINSYLLLGLTTPEEFLEELVTSGVSDKDAREIVNEINQKIFVPLREEMRKSQVAEVKPPQPQRSELRNVLNAVTAKPSQPPPSLPASSLQPPASRLLEDHEEPHIDISDKVQGVSPQTIRTQTPAPLKPYHLPLTSVPPNLPGVIHHPPFPTQKPVLPATPPKPYSSDPYREPIE